MKSYPDKQTLKEFVEERKALWPPETKRDSPIPELIAASAFVAVLLFLALWLVSPSFGQKVPYPQNPPEMSPQQIPQQTPQQRFQPQPRQQGQYIYQMPPPRPIKQRFNPIYVAPDGQVWIARRVGLFGWHVRWFPLPKEVR